MTKQGSVYVRCNKSIYSFKTEMVSYKLKRCSDELKTSSEHLLLFCPIIQIFTAAGMPCDYGKSLAQVIKCFCSKILSSFSQLIFNSKKLIVFRYAVCT